MQTYFIERDLGDLYGNGSVVERIYYETRDGAMAAALVKDREFPGKVRLYQDTRMVIEIPLSAAVPPAMPGA